MPLIKKAVIIKPENVWGLSVKLNCPPESITHLHLLSVLAAEIKARGSDGTPAIRILDAGCGSGHLDTFLYGNLVVLFPGLRFEIYGYDVGDHGVQPDNFIIKTLDWCCGRFPEIPWRDRFKLILQDQQWPYENDFFDFVISNQVLEHVLNHDHFFSEHYRVLKCHGSGVHLFPLKHYVYEGHLLLPFVHRISDWNLLKSYIRLLSRAGLGKYSKRGPVSIEDFSEKHADYMTFRVNYLKKGELFEKVRRAQLRPSLKYTSDFYFHKLRSVLGLGQAVDLKGKRDSGFSCWLLSNIFKYISSITLFVEKENTYRR